MKLIRDKHSNHYCGPAAVALLTGVHVDEAARALRAASGERAVKGTVNRHMMTALSLLGHMAIPVPTQSVNGRPPTLTQALKGALRGRQVETRYLVTLTGHYVVIQGRKLYDNKHPQGVRLTECPYRRKRVRALFSVVILSGKPGGAALPPKLPPKSMLSAEFKRRLSKLGLSTDWSFVDAPDHRQFQSGLHSLAFTGTFEEMLTQVSGEMPLVPCPEDCDCRLEFDAGRTE
jgi:hypothetical protein